MRLYYYVQQHNLFWVDTLILIKFEDTYSRESIDTVTNRELMMEQRRVIKRQRLKTGGVVS